MIFCERRLIAARASAWSSQAQSRLTELEIELAGGANSLATESHRRQSNRHQVPRIDSSLVGTFLRHDQRRQLGKYFVPIAAECVL